MRIKLAYNYLLTDGTEFQEDIPLTINKFPDGQLNVDIEVPSFSRLNKSLNNIDFHIQASINSMDAVLAVLQINDVLQAQGYSRIHLHITYLLGARMDRRMNANTPFTAKIVTDLLNTVKWQSVSILDPHSDVTPALLNATSILPKRLYVTAAKHLAKNIVVVVPDAGAGKRVYQAVEVMTSCVRSKIPMIQGLKHRDVKTGKLSGFEITSPELIKDKNIIIVDDICDGGGTFLGLGDKILEHNPKSLNLVVTHGIFSQGFTKLLDKFDAIFTTNSYQDIWSLEDYDPIKVFTISTLNV